jgi:DNA-binding response OmpR family regulator
MAKPKLLVVEDDHSIADLYLFKFDIAGFEVRAAYDGEQGLKAAEDFLPEIILLDLRMPVMNGDEMLEKLRAEDWGADMRVIILTNISRDEAPGNLRFLGVDRYVVKAHHTPTQVFEMVKEVLGTAG